MIRRNIVRGLAVSASTVALVLTAGAGAVGAAVDTSTSTAEVTSTLEVASTTTVPNPPVQAQDCPSAVRDRLSNYAVTVDGVPAANLHAVHSGAEVTVSFTVAAGCTEPLSLASYAADTTSIEPAALVQQRIFDSATGTFAAGAHTLSISLPPCGLQVDFVRGPVIQQFGPVGSSNFYGGRIIDTALVTPQICAMPSETTTTTGAPTTTTTAPTTTTSAPEVLPQVVEQTTTTTLAPTEVLGESETRPALAATGPDVRPTIALGAVFLLLGAASLGAARSRADAA